MKETGVIFKAHEVRAILSGQKTQFRRVIKQATGLSLSVGMDDDAPGVAELSWLWGDGPGYEVNETIKRVACPFGKPRDRIYVRETWQGPLLEEFESDADSDWMSPSRIHQYQNPAHCQYAADGGPAPEFMTADDDLVRCWRPSIHMPKWAARIWLEVTGVRVERLQSISEADARAEGAPLKNSPAAHLTSYRRGFQEVWESTGGDWPANPWVWVIDFKRIEKESK